MKSLLVAGAFIFFSGVAQVETFMPENDLWQQDCIDCESNSPMTKEIFNKIIDAAKTAYAPDAAANNEGLKINALWDDPTVNANCLRSGKKVEINMYGGLARRAEVNLEGFALVVCHELGGHAYGGAPYIQISNKMSAEGQSDWTATGLCYSRVAALVPELKEKFAAYDHFSQSKCLEAFGKENPEDPRVIDCINGAEGALSLGTLLAVLSKETPPKFETPDPLVVTKTQLSYPKTTQCRLDSYLAGLLGQPRPLCWYKPQ